MPRDSALVSPLVPGSTIGIVGAGQLGRYLAMAAAKLGLHALIYAPDPESPAFETAQDHVCAAYDDEAALTRFAKRCDAVTFEFENVPASALRTILAHRPVFPGVKAAEVAQDRRLEKQFLSEIGLPVAPYVIIDTQADLKGAQAFLAQAQRGILKSAREGYDGKGQARVASSTDLEAAFTPFNLPCVLEGLVPFCAELSVIAVRGQNGEMACYDPSENVHKNGILHQSQVPSSFAPNVIDEAQNLACRIAAALDYVGVLGVELFVVKAEGRHDLIVNEIAPRVHNTGHWTLDGCAISQFENHIRAVAGWPLGSVERHSDALMTNLLGEDALAWRTILEKNPAASLHLYGKKTSQTGRKMGHVTELSPLQKKEENLTFS